MTAQVEPRIHQTSIEIPYKWTAGEIIGSFLGGLKEGKIFGGHCKNCKIVLVPVPDVCPHCLYDFKVDDFVQISGEGEIAGFTVVHHKLLRFITYHGQPELPQPPYALTLIKLNGADTNFLHLVYGDDLKKIAVGKKVKPIWREEKKGFLLDIERFTII